MNSVRFLYMSTLADRIAEIISELDGPDRGKQVRLANIAGCSRGLINQLLKVPGQQLGYEFAKNIEKRLGYRVEWILEGSMPKWIGAEDGSVTRPTITPSPEGIEVGFAYDRLTKQDQRTAVLAQLRAFGVWNGERFEAAANDADITSRTNSPIASSKKTADFDMAMRMLSLFQRASEDAKEIIMRAVEGVIDHDESGAAFPTRDQT